MTITADDQPMVSAGFGRCLPTSPTAPFVAETIDGACRRDGTQHVPDVVLMDIRIPVVDGSSDAELIADSGPAAFWCSRPSDAFDALRVSASGFAA